MLVGLLKHSLYKLTKIQKDIGANDNESININGIIIGTYSEVTEFAKQLDSKITGWDSGD